MGHAVSVNKASSDNHERRRRGKLKWLCCLMNPMNTEIPVNPSDSLDTTLCPMLEREWVSLPSATHLQCHPSDSPDTTLCPMLEREWVSLPSATHLQCGCCCSDVPFEDMVQCADGHLFCFTCLRRRIEESTFGGLPARGPLACMDMAGCDKSIPWSEIQRVIKGDLLIKFEQRQANDSVARAMLLGLIHCPACNFACEVDADVSVFNCPNKSCQKATCMKCKEPFHMPLRCEDVEKPPETHMRNEVEEIMSKSLIRECMACKAKLVKEGGCNKITCRCGQGMCYICRQPVQNYKHFCEHFRSPDQPCKSCNKCNLWEQEDNNRVVQNAKKAAIESKAKEDPSILAREIGPAESFFLINKKRRR